MKKIVYYIALTCVAIMALLSTVTAITNITFFGYYPINQLTVSKSSDDYSVKKINFDFKTEAIATFKSNDDEQKVAI